MKRIVFSLCLTFTVFSYLQAQFDAQFSQYMFNPTGFNPAAVGDAGMMDVTGQHRLQWVGMPNGGSTTLFNINTPINLGGKKHGIGLNFVNDEVGLFVNQAVHFQYALGLNIGKGQLKVGTQLGFMSIGFRGDSVRGPQNPQGEYHDIGSDPAIPSSLSEGFGLDIGLGAWYTLKNFYAGISYSHLNQPIIEWSDQHTFTPVGTLYMTGGYSFAFSDPKYVFKPSTLFKTDFVSFQLDLSSVIHYNNQYWGGLSYRYGDAVVVLAGIQIGNGLSIGYAYDLPVSKVISASWGSHEFMLSYQINVQTGTDSNRKKYKNIRIL